MINTIKQEAQQRMQKSVDSLQTELARIRTGRAHPSLLDHIMVDCYGSSMPLSQVCSINVSDARTLTLSPWDKTMVSPIEKAILSANLGLNPATTGTVIRVPMPPLTEDRRKELIKVARQEAESARVAIRNIRRDANGQLKDLSKEKEITEDQVRAGEEAHQKLTDKFIAEIDSLLNRKEMDLMEV